MKIINLFIVSMLLHVSGIAQEVKITVTEGKRKIEGYDMKGASAKVLFDFTTTESALLKELKKYGKVEKNRPPYVVIGASIPSFSSDLIDVYAELTSETGATSIWIGTKQNAKNVKEFVYNFCLDMYKKDLETQISEAESVILNTNKEYQRKITGGEKLQADLEDNKKEKLKLEQSLQQNGIEKIELEKAIEQNKLDKAALLTEVEKVKKVVEAKKLKLSQLK